MRTFQHSLRHSRIIPIQTASTRTTSNGIRQLNIAICMRIDIVRGGVFLVFLAARGVRARRVQMRALLVDVEVQLEGIVLQWDQWPRVA